MIEGIIAAIIGVLGGVSGTVFYEKRRQIGGKSKAEKEIAEAKIKASDIVLKAKDEAIQLENERRSEWKKTENRLAERETTLDRKIDELDKRSEKVRNEERGVEDLKNEIRDIRAKQQEKLEKIAKLTKTEAADKLMEVTERDIKQDLVGLINKLDSTFKYDPASEGFKGAYADVLRKTNKTMILWSKGLTK